MTAYYNEHDPKAAAWLRELIARGHIAPGVVDERSIEDITADDLAGFVQCHFFAGIGVWSYALRLAGWPDDRPVWTGSCPCQPFSTAGEGGGFDDERHLWPAWFWLIEQCRPRVVFGEQVSSKDGLGWLDLVSSDMEGAGYAIGALDSCAAGVGAPHIRQRLYFGAERLADADAQHLRGGLRPRDGETSAAQDGLSERQWRRDDDGSCGAFGWLADATDQRHERGGAARGWRDGFTDRSNIIGLADADDAGLEGRREPGRECADQRAARPDGMARGLADADDARRSERQRNDTPARYWNTSTSTCGDDRLERTGQTNGFWRSADWLRCRDDRWRPVEPGTFPLAHGVAARVGRLRGYGNGLVAPHAATFITSFEEALRQVGD